MLLIVKVSVIVTMPLNRELPKTPKVVVGAEVPIPTFPAASITNGEASLASSLTAKDNPVPIFSTPKIANGVVEAMPTLFSDASTKSVFVSTIRLSTMVVVAIPPVPEAMESSWIPPVDKPNSFAPTRKIPVSVSPEKLNAGAPAVPF